ncbi:MAG: DUF4364 family protein [Clostridiales bacterium]|jgi:predicted transcriptional regulator|nr:DUF4364 family protein [Clostridiales bacterium]
MENNQTVERTGKKLIEEKRAALLFLLKEVKVSLSLTRFMELIYETELIDYFNGMNSMGDLEDEGFVNVTTMGDERYFQITTQGRDAVEFSSEILPAAVRERISECALEILRGEHDLHKTYTKTLPLRDGAFYFQCGAMEHGEPIFELRVRTGDKEQSRRMSEYFRSHTMEVFAKTFEILGEEKGEQNAAADN